MSSTASGGVSVFFTSALNPSALLNFLPPLAQRVQLARRLDLEARPHRSRIDDRGLAVAHHRSGRLGERRLLNGAQPAPGQMLASLQGLRTVRRDESEVMVAELLAHQGDRTTALSALK
jgi:hypothetical protein